MTVRTIYVVIGIGANGGGELGVMCPTWPDCDAGIPYVDPANPSPYDHNGFVLVQGPGNYTAVGGTVFDSDYEARGWLEFDEAGRNFRAAFLNVLILRTTAAG